MSRVLNLLSFLPTWRCRGGQPRRRCLLVAVFALVFIPGCYEHVSQGDQSIYRFAWWAGALVIAGGLLGIPLGLLMCRWTKRFGIGLIILAPILLIIVAPAMYSDHVVVDSEHFEARYGFWFSPTIHNIRFRDLREIRYVSVPGNRGRLKYELHCLSNAGTMHIVSAGDLVRNTVPEILERARASGIPVFNQAQ